MVKKKVTKSKPAKSSVYVQTSTGVFPYQFLKDAEIEAKTESKQLKQKQRWLTQNGLIPAVYPPESFLKLFESNVIYNRCVHQIATDVAGLGWKVKLREGNADNTTELERINEFLKHPNEDEHIRKIFEKLLIDWGTLGHWSLEISLNNLGEVGKIYHVPVHTISVHKTKIKYCQKRSNKTVWFRKFGQEKYNISTKEGKKISGRGRGAANDMIFYKNYYALSEYYGVPNVLSATGDVIGMLGQRDYNLSFFENFGVPAAIITLKGDWEKDAEKKISEYIDNTSKGAVNQHRTMVMRMGDGENDEFKYEKLNVDVKEGSFNLYEQGRRDNILIAYSMPPERIGIRIVGKLGGNVAKEATQTYVQGVVEPLQLDLEEIVNDKFLKSEIYEFKFNNVDLRDYDALVDRLVKQVIHGMKTPNEARNELGLKPYTDGDKFFIVTNVIESGEPDPDDMLMKVRDLITGD